MVLTVKTIKQPGLYPAIVASTVGVAADDVTLQAPSLNGEQGQVLYGVEVKRNLLGRYYRRTVIQGGGEIREARNKGVLLAGADGVIDCTPQAPLEIHHCGQDAVSCSAANFHVEGVYAHHLGVRAYSSTKPHAEGVEVIKGWGVISQCKIDLPDLWTQGYQSNSCIYIESSYGPIGEVTINSCELLGSGTTYPLFIVIGKYGPPKRVEVFNTTIVKGVLGRHVNWDLANPPSWLYIDPSCTLI